MDEGESRNLNKETFVPKITEITVSAGRTFNHPHESFSNLKPHVALKVEVLPGEDAGEVAKRLQVQAEGLVEDLKQSMLKSLEELYHLSKTQARIEGLRSTIERAQRELNVARKELPAPTLDQDQIEDEVRLRLERLRDLAVPTLDPDQVEDEEDEEEKEPKAGRRRDHLRY